MAGNPHYQEAARNAMLDTINTALGASPLFRIYSGTQPANCDAAVTGGNVVVASLPMAATAFGAAASGVITAATITSDASAVGGSANWFAIVMATGTRIADGNISTSGADLNLNSQTITTGATVSISAFTITLAA